MSEVARYILSITGAAMLVAILQSIAGQGAMGQLVRMLGGIFLALTILAPLVHLELPDLSRWVEDMTLQGQDISADGEAMAADLRGDIITQQVEAYILDKAAVHQADVSVEVAVDEDGVPVSVRLTGDVAPYAKARLSEMMEQELGMGKEAQQWESPYQAG